MIWHSLIPEACFYNMEKKASITNLVNLIFHISWRLVHMFFACSLKGAYELYRDHRSVWDQKRGYARPAATTPQPK